ncbi:MAG: hypothetical protein GWN79_17400 [Actinobacteria bacterium]|nr:hypothetical protein [Actinomycetota bacterium]NIS33746.1 hypothetical protein [Actinomycetota bacterium]NIT97069.1 hypothetical protein [Actinomycetota bacterium]NIU20739.1 hypothetical protein [Actinomycetota bacterium]NIU68591.1 hypothetical protein [Actinomycetota bacterium]
MLIGTALGLVALNVALGAVHVFTSVGWSWLVATHLGVASVALVALVAAVTVAAGGALDEERNETAAAAT